MVTHAFNIKNSMSMLVQKSQDHKKAKDHKMMIRDYAWLMISRSSRSHSCQVKDTSQSLKSKITTSCSQDKVKKSSGYNLSTYYDSDWLGCPDIHRSSIGHVLILDGAPISWKTKKQSVVSRLHIASARPTPLFYDNQATCHIANNPVFHEQTKHVEMDCYFVSERVDFKEIQPFQVDSKMQIANLLTKGLGTQQLRFLLAKLGTYDLHAPT
ncbi:secreted RxLR effector protein 161-like protein [Tanacetum coccineum]